ADVGVCKDVAAQAVCREVRCRDTLILALLDVQDSERICALVPAESRAAEDGQRLATVGQPDATGEEQPHILWRIPAATEPIVAESTTLLVAERENALV